MKSAMIVREKSVGARPSLYATGNNAAATVTITAGATSAVKCQLYGVCWSYSGTPTNGRLTIFGGGFNFDIDITNSGPGFIPFPAPLHATNDTNVVVTLAAGGAGVIGKLNVLGHGIEDS